MVFKVRGHAMLFLCLLAAFFLETDSQATCATVTCQNGNCKIINGNPKCECNTGYMTNRHDNTICDDVDECKYGSCIPNGWCVNSQGSFRCGCYYGYRPANTDSTYCVRYWWSWGGGGGGGGSSSWWPWMWMMGYDD